MSVFERQYARALADVAAQDHLDLDVVERQLREFLSAYSDNRELREALLNPSIPLDPKLGVLDAITRRMELGKQVRNFLAILLKNDRIHALRRVAVEYRKEIDSRLHRERVEITSVRELTPEEKSSVEQKAASLSGVAVQPIYRQDPKLLGGIVVRIGDTVYDGSVRGSLDKLREKLLVG